MNVEMFFIFLLLKKKYPNPFVKDVFFAYAILYPPDLWCYSNYSSMLLYSLFFENVYIKANVHHDIFTLDNL